MTSGSSSEEILDLSSGLREHRFTPTNVLKICSVCSRIIKSNVVAWECHDCHKTVHDECKDYLPVPCMSVSNRQIRRGKLLQGNIADYAPVMPPFVPSLVSRCIHEIKLRGCKERFSYREKAHSVKARLLSREYLTNKKLMNLKLFDLDTIASTLIIFLKSLSEPLITDELLDDFVTASLSLNKERKNEGLLQAISMLPLPNRDTLAYLINHFQQITIGPEMRRLRKYLANIFGPIVVGGSSRYLTPTVMTIERRHQTAVVANLLDIDSNYWTKFANPYRPQLSRSEPTPGRRVFRNAFSDPHHSVWQIVKRIRREVDNNPSKTD